jgi:hypothetical protein
VKYDAQNQTYYPEIIWDCTVCHSTVLRPGSPVPPPEPLPKNPPAITSFSPVSPTLDIVGTTRKFNVTFDQKVNLTWYIEDTLVQDNNSITEASYINSGADLGVWNVSVNASNGNGSAMFTWRWNLTSTPLAPSITSSYPTSPVNDTVGSSRKFGIAISQTADIVWKINGNPVQYNNGVEGASYNNTSAKAGIWNVSVIATNANGSVMRSWTWNVTSIPIPIPPPIPPPIPALSPAITGFDPTSPVNNIAGESRRFNITIDQIVNVIWYINGTPIQSNRSITDARYTNISASSGIWNVTAMASNVNGSVMRTWTWNVTSIPPPVSSINLILKITNVSQASDIQKVILSKGKYSINIHNINLTQFDMKVYENGVLQKRLSREFEFNKKIKDINFDITVNNALVAFIPYGKKGSIGYIEIKRFK